MSASFPKYARLFAGLTALTIGQLANAGGERGDSSPADGQTDVYFSHRSSGPAIPDKNIGNEILYQIVVDRFANGNSQNDCLFEGRFCAKNQHDFKWYSYYGGDLRGLIDRLPYIKNLGATRLWLTPIFENSNVIVETFKYGKWVEPTSYHGYWIRDWFRLNPMFTDRGTQDYDIVGELVSKAKPMRLYLDTVANHTSPADASDDSLDYLSSIEPIQNAGETPHRGALFRDGEYITGFDLDRKNAEENRNYRPYFHQDNRKIINWEDPWEVLNLQLDRLVDFDQNSPNVRKYMEDAHAFWLQKFPDLAGYRIDTIKHVPQQYWSQLSSAMYSRFSKMEAFGEYWDAGALNPQSHAFYRDTRFSMLDFDFRRALLNTFGPSNKPFSEITDVWKNDPSLVDATQLITFLDNHDFPRARGIGLDQTEMRQAMTLLMMARGIPCLYYGMEQDLFYPQDPGDPFNRPMMKSFDTNTADFVLLKKLIATRKSNLAARHGVTHVVHESNNILAFERVYGSDMLFFATSKNNIHGSDEFEINDINFPDGSYRDVLTGKVYQIRDSKITVSLRRGDSIVLDSHQKSR